MPETTPQEERLAARGIISQLVPSLDELGLDESPSEFIKKLWAVYAANFQSNQNLNGKVFEELIAISLIRAGIMPFYMQAKATFIPNVNYDFLIYTRNVGPVSISAKTSLRERWKQADLEALALKNIHRQAESYLVSLDESAIRVRQGDIGGSMALDGFVLATSASYDSLLEHIKQYSLILPDKVDVVSSNFVVTSENYLDRYGK